MVCDHTAPRTDRRVGDGLEYALENDAHEAGEESAEAVFDRARDAAAEHGADIATEVGMGHLVRAMLNRRRLRRGGDRELRRVADRPAVRRHRREEGNPPVARFGDSRPIGRPVTPLRTRERSGGGQPPDRRLETTGRARQCVGSGPVSTPYGNDRLETYFGRRGAAGFRRKCPRPDQPGNGRQSARPYSRTGDRVRADQRRGVG